MSAALSTGTEVWGWGSTLHVHCPHPTHHPHCRGESQQRTRQGSLAESFKSTTYSTHKQPAAWIWMTDWHRYFKQPKIYRIMNFLVLDLKILEMMCLGLGHTHWNHLNMHWAELSTADLGESRWTNNSARLGWCSGAGRVKSKDIEAETLSIKLTITHK